MKSTKTTSKTLTREQIDERINIKNITKDELAEKIAEKTGVAKKTVKTVLTDTLDSIMEKYGVTLEELKKYNDLTNLQLGDKLIIPNTYERD